MTVVATVSEPEEPDAERVVVEGEVIGSPVDPPNEPRTLYATVTGIVDRELPPIVPAWMRNSGQRRVVAVHSAKIAAHRAGWHAWHSPKYLLKVAFYAPVGVLKALWIIVHWAWDLEGRSIRQAAATRNDVAEYVMLSRQRDKRVGGRGRLLILPAILLTVGVVLFLHLTPQYVQVITGSVLLVPLAIIGRPKDKPITDRAMTGPSFTKLTAEMVRFAMASIGLAKIKEPGDIKFEEPGIHRDGPGWLARVNLPAGVTVQEVLERRARLSSALRLPVDQVWPSKGPGHEGQLDLWVGYLPASRMGQPKWSLAKPHARTSVFSSHEFGSDERQRPVKTSLFARNFLIGGLPGSGKSYAARTLVTIAALDPSCELKICEYKGTGDFSDFAPLCSTYACGLADEDFETGAGILAWALAEAERRAARIKQARLRGDAPEGKVTPELAAKRGSGLHPVVIVIDEAHELFGDAAVGKEACQAAIRLAKRGRALGIILILCTQIPDADSIPTALTRVMNMRWCLAVRDYYANDAILGTGMHKAGITATVYRPEDDAGWGLMVGLKQPMGVRAQYPGAAAERSIVARAGQLRGRVVGDDLPDEERRDFLHDVRTVFYAGEVFLTRQTLATRLRDAYPAFYGDWTANEIGPAVKRCQVDLELVDGREKGGESVLKGLRFEHLSKALEQREIEAKA